MSSNFSFPPPPPPPPKRAPDPQYPQHQQFRGGRGGRGAHGRGRGGQRGRGSYGGQNHYGAPQQHQYPPNNQQGQAWAPNLGGWASQQAQNMMAMYGAPMPPAYAQALPQFWPGMFPQAMQQQEPEGQDMTQAQQDSSSASLQQGTKRKREVAPRQPAAPPVPSFGAPIPQWRPQSSASDASAHSENKQETLTKSQNKKQKKKNNQLGLTPGGEDHEESEDDAEEEARFAEVNSSGPIRVTHGNQTIVLSTPAHFKAWLDERKKKFPTTARVKQKKEEAIQRKQEQDTVNRQMREARRQEQEENIRKKQEKKKVQQQSKAGTDEAEKENTKTASQEQSRLSSLGARNTTETDTISQKPESRRLYISNVSYSAVDSDIMTFAKDYHPELVERTHNVRTGGPTGRAFITVANASEAHRAVKELNGKLLLDRNVVVQLANNQGQHTASTSGSGDGQDAHTTAREPNGDIAMGGQSTKPFDKATDLSSAAPSAQKVERLERLKAKAEKYRRLAEEAEISAMQARAQSLGYRLVKDSPNEQQNSAPTAELGTTKVPASDNHKDVVMNDVHSVATQPASVHNDQRTTASRASTSDLFTVDIAGDQKLALGEHDRIVEPKRDAIEPEVEFDDSMDASSISSHSSDSDSEVSSDSDSDGGDQDIAEMVDVSARASVRTSPARTAGKDTKLPKMCNAILNNLPCKFGDSCRYSHDLAQHSLRQARPIKPRQAETKRLTLHERLLQQQQDQQNALALNAIKYLGDQGLLNDVDEANDAMHED